ADGRAGGGEAVAGRADRHDLDVGPRREGPRHPFRLDPGKSAPARAEPELHGVGRLLVAVQAEDVANRLDAVELPSRIGFGLEAPERLVQEPRRERLGKTTQALAL